MFGVTRQWLLLQISRINKDIGPNTLFKRLRNYNYALYNKVSYPKEELKGFRNFEQKQMFCSSNGGGGCDWSMRTLLLLTITFLWWCPIFRLRRLGRTYKQFVCSLYYFCLFTFHFCSFAIRPWLITTFVLFGKSLQSFKHKITWCLYIFCFCIINTNENL